MPDLIQLTPHLSVLPCHDMYYNAGVFISAGEACLIDPGLVPDEMDGLEAKIKSEGALLKAMILTHAHWDHVLGPERFPNCPTIAQE